MKEINAINTKQQFVVRNRNKFYLNTKQIDLEPDCLTNV